MNETEQTLDNEIRECEQKRDGVKQSFDSLDKEFIENSLKAADESDAIKMKELLVKGRGMKQEAEKSEIGCSTGKCDCCPEEEEKIRVK